MRSDHDAIGGGGYLFRALSPSQTTAIAMARAFGASPRDLAAEYGVSTRTIYRACRQAGQRTVTVHVADWHAEFVIGDEGPVRVTAWHATGARS
jgi:DNA-directed RNA polymerase specialized sigma24 family protein